MTDAIGDRGGDLAGGGLVAVESNRGPSVHPLRGLKTGDRGLMTTIQEQDRNCR